MRSTRSFALALCMGALTVLGACQTAGPRAISLGRERYNGILQSTAMEQTMSNIVRVYHHELPMFMEVTEVDAVLTVGGSLTGAATNIGAGANPKTSGGTFAGQVEAVTGVANYSETPTIRYQPLLGQALVAQLITPVSVDALGLMYDSSWDIGPLLDFSSAYLTLDHREFYSALDTITELSDLQALELAAARNTMSQSDQAGAPGGSSGPASSPKPGGGGNDALVLYLLPFHHSADAADLPYKERVTQLWARMFRIYLDSQVATQANGQPSFVPKNAKACADIGLTLDEAALRNWDVDIAQQVAKVPDDQKSQLLGTARSCLPSAIELRILPTPLLTKGGQGAAMTSSGFASYAPLMRTYSALGILRNATGRPGPKIEFVTPEVYDQIRREPWNGDVSTLKYYTLLSADLDSVDCSEASKLGGGCDTTAQSPEQKETVCEINRWIRASAQKASPPCKSAAPPAAYERGLDVYEASGTDVLGADSVNMNGALGTLRRYILVVVGDHLPAGGAYASFYDRGKWYYIAGDDTVSEKNFQLLSLFLTMMAVPPSTQPLSPTINVGG